MITINEKWVGIDIDPNISLFEYGFLCSENENGTYTVIVCTNVTGVVPDSLDEALGMAYEKYTSSMDELIETSKESWFELDKFESTTGIKIKEFSSFDGLCHDMIQYYGVENILGGNGYILPESALKLIGAFELPSVTELESQVLKNICLSEYGEGETIQQRIGEPVWSWSATNQKKNLAGALGSCIKKGLCESDGEKGNDATCWITSLGVAYLESINFQI